MVNFAACKRGWYPDVRIGWCQIALILENLILEYQMIPPGIPGELGGQAMILMSIVQPVREDYVRFDFRFKILEKILRIGVLRWQVTVTEVCNQNLACGCAPQQRIRTSTRLRSPRPLRTEDDPSYLDCGHARQPGQQSPTTANLNVVAMCADT